jgi:catechol 2,3-dioxygenase-like lactoylglutathione lyase family enzyme
MSGGIEGIGQIHITVRDIDRAVVFYGDTLGLPLLFEVPGQDMAFFDCGGVRLYLGRAESDEFMSRPLLYYRVSGIEDEHARLAGGGVVFHDAPHVVHRDAGMELVLCFFNDSEGNVVALMEERPAAEPG